MKTRRTFLKQAGGLSMLSAVPTGLLGALSSADPLESYVGLWLVVPGASPKAPAPGGIPRVFRIWREGESLSGLFTWCGQDFVMRDMAVQNDSLTFVIVAKNPDAWEPGPAPMIAKHSQYGRGLDVWIGRRAEGEVTFPTLGLTESQLDAVMQAAPKIDPWQKRALPPLRAVPSNGLARTPPMGWSSWNLFRSSIDERTVREIADAMVSSGLRDAGYVYVNIDDGWQGRRDAAGVLNANQNFPDMKALAEYLHARGLKFGIYSSPGLISYDGFLGSHGHEAQDARTFAQWGVDYLKYDFGYAAATLYKTQPEIEALYQIMGEALQATGRPIVYALSPELYDVGSWGREVGGNLWRTGGDSVAGNPWRAIDSRFEGNGKPEDAGPGGWNDADMVLVGLPGLTEEECRTHFTLWAMSASPLILGNDIRAMPPAVQALLTNKEVIAVDQDALGQQGRRVLQMGQTEIWKKILADGSTAVALFNRGEASAEVQVRWKDLGIERVTAIRNLWMRTNLKTNGTDFRAAMSPHSTVLLRVESANDGHLEQSLTAR